MTWSVHSIARAFVPSTQTLDRVASGATSLFCLLPAYDAATATIKAAAKAGINCQLTLPFVWKQVYTILGWQTMMDISYLGTDCSSIVLGTGKLAVLAISSTLLSVYLAKRCLRKSDEEIQVHLSPRTQEAAESVANHRATLVRKPLPDLPPQARPPAPPSGDYTALAAQANKQACTIM